MSRVSPFRKQVKEVPDRDCPTGAIVGTIRIWLAAICGMVALFGSASPAEAACRQFAVVGEDASYLLLDGETWDVLRVGNYWVTGIRRVSGVLPGSGDRRTAFRTNGLVSVYDREPLIDGAAPADGAPNAVALLRMLSYAPRATERSFWRGRYQEFLWPPYFYTLEDSARVNSDQWVHWLRGDSLFRAFEVDGTTAVYHLTGDFQPEEFVSGDEAEPGELEILNVWDIGGMDLSMPFCAVGDRLYFTDEANALSVPAAGGPGIERRPLAALVEGGYELTPLHTKNCKALARRAIPDDPELFEYALYDIAADTIQAEFTSPAPTRNILFAAGARWLQQLALHPGADEPVPSATFRLLDTTTGELLREAALDAIGGELIEEIQCDADTPRAVIAGSRRIWLLDPTTLSIVAENEIPFERDYFVFE